MRNRCDSPFCNKDNHQVKPYVPITLHRVPIGRSESKYLCTDCFTRGDSDIVTTVHKYEKKLKSDIEDSKKNK